MSNAKETSLILDSSNGRLVVTIIKNNNIYSSISEKNNSQVEEICLAIVSLMIDAEVDNFEEIDNFGANIGPGSFTGVRVAIGYLVGCFSFCTNEKYFVEFDTLDILKNQIDEKNVISVMKADNFGNYFVKYCNSDKILIQKYEEIQKIDKCIYALDNQIDHSIFQDFQITSVDRVSISGMKNSYFGNIDKKKKINSNSFFINPKYCNSFV